ARVAAIRAAVPELALRVDVNGACTAEQACALARALAGCDLEWIEQPVAAEDVAGLARVRRHGGVPVAADEAGTGAQAGWRRAAATRAGVFVVKLAQAGGLARARDAALVAHAIGLPIAVTTSIDGGIATAAALHLAGWFPGTLRACGVATSALLLGDMVTA